MHGASNAGVIRRDLEAGRPHVKLLSAIFVAVLLAGHGLIGPEAADLPLSMLRDGPFPAFGHAAFLSLLGMGPLMVLASWRAGERVAAGFYGVAAAMLVFVAASPSADDTHLLASLLLLVAFYVYYARELFEAESYWVFAHLLAPPVLALASGCFGLWQKSLIVYFLVAANIHYRVMAPARRAPGEISEAEITPGAGEQTGRRAGRLLSRARTAPRPGA
jgi:hypothetical protein